MDPNLKASGSKTLDKNTAWIKDLPNYSGEQKYHGGHVFSSLDALTEKGIDWLMNNVSLGGDYKHGMGPRTPGLYKSKETRQKSATPFKLKRNK